MNTLNHCSYSNTFIRKQTLIKCPRRQRKVFLAMVQVLSTFETYDGNACSAF